MDHAARGAAALNAGNYNEAITHYTKAIASSPQAVIYYIKRATAYQRSAPPDHTSALRDAETAVVLADKRGKRELIAQAQLRRAVALFGLDQWANAGFCFGVVRKLNEKETSLGIWDSKVKTKLQGIAEHDERREITVKELPDLPEVGQQENKEEKTHGKSAEVEEKASVAEGKKPEGVQTPANKIRHEWYQTTDNVVITLLAKGVPKDKAVIDIQEGSVSISFPLPNSSTFDFSLEPLFAPINSATSTSAIMSTKIEIILKKATPGQKWPSLEGSHPINGKEIESQDQSNASESVKRAVLNSASAPAYPTSSRSGPKNWDKLATDLTKKPKKAATEGDKDSKEEDDGIDEFDDEGGDPVNGFFKKLYAGADPDTRRAMMKSYQESNGTALSTNWSEVGKGKVETSPPDGMEAKKWEA
ncbi:MAG: hypothetical protein M1835_003354 [Candelina submexicana]|nr:MAG: hypothetical protein M1835_003354 [Candelina submexicana]